MFASFTGNEYFEIDGVRFNVVETLNEVLTEDMYWDDVAAIKRQNEVRDLGLMQSRHNRELGTCVTRLDPGIFNHWESISGPGCWSDKSERESILKFAPELRCKTEKPMDRVGYGTQFGSGYDRMTVAGSPTTQEERMLIQ